ncbi:hypothetical protein BH09MYX1_BH09MYX1_62090 [soil metagenome]
MSTMITFKRTLIVTSLLALGALAACGGNDVTPYTSSGNGPSGGQGPGTGTTKPVAEDDDLTSGEEAPPDPTFDTDTEDPPADPE